MKKKILILLLTVATLSSCNQAPTTEATSTPAVATSPTPPAQVTETPALPAATVPSDWSRVESKDGKVKMAVPPSWIVVDENNPETKQKLDELKKNNPGIANADTSSYHLMVIDTEVKDNFADNLNVIKKTVPQTFPFTQETADALKAEFAKTMPIEGEMNIAPTKISHGDAFRYDASIKMAQGDGSTMTLGIIGYLMFQNTDMYVFTYSTTPANMETFKATAEQIMNSTTITP